jgi:single-strand DNA-binding protein
MPNYNKVLLAGNLTRDPEIRITPAGKSVGQFGLAVNRRWRDEGGNDREEVLFVDVEVFGKQADTLAKYTGKGKPLFVEGRLKLDQWEDKNSGEKKSRLKIVLESFQFLGAADGAQTGQGAPQKPAPRATPAPAPQAPDDGAESPF